MEKQFIATRIKYPKVRRLGLAREIQMMANMLAAIEARPRRSWKYADAEARQGHKAMKASGRPYIIKEGRFWSLFASLNAKQVFLAPIC